MTKTKSLENEYEELLGYRAGARYCKVDLHTHTPASECSSYALPEPLETIVRANHPKSGVRAACRRAYSLLKDVASGENPFAEALRSDDVTKLPRLCGTPKPNVMELQRIAMTWIDAICRERGEETDANSIETSGRPYEMLKLAFRDIENYIASLFFPEEFVLRCYIEELQVVALTDHNHPGFVVPRVQELGTWYGALQAVNKEYVRDLRENAGRRVRDTVIARLSWAADKLAEPPMVRTDSTTKSQHKEAGKKQLEAQKAREDHILERLAHWNKTSNPLRRVVLLPGVEITVSAVHMLAVFPPKWYVPGRIGAILRAIGIPEEQWGQGFIAAATSSVQDTMTLVAENGGIAVPAHSNSDFKGLLRLFRRGLELRKVLEHPALTALEKVRGTVIAAAEKGKKGKATWETLRWLAEDSRRRDRARPLCFIKGSDAHECRIECDGTGEDLGSRYTNVKIDLRPFDTPDETFAALRLAMLSGQGRVIEFPTEDGYNYQADAKVKRADRIKLLDRDTRRPTILGIAVSGEGSYADGLCVRFSPYLNCVVGSGGKSTLVRMLGYAFGAQGFMPQSPKTWLPDLVRVYWEYDDAAYCVERRGRHANPNEATTTWYRRSAAGDWTAFEPESNSGLQTLGCPVEIWPSAEIQDGRGSLSRFEDDVIQELKRLLQFRKLEDARPLLINQPRDIFNGRELFDEVLAKPHLKARQIIWSTGSANVPVAMDAEKILITRELNDGKKMELVCGGDLSETDVRDAFLDCSEGGYLAFRRRQALYGL